MKLAYRPPYDWSSLVQFIQARAISGVEKWTETSYRRSVSFFEAVGMIEVTYVIGHDYLLLTVPSTLCKYLTEIIERIERQFDLKVDPTEITTHLNQDPRLAPLVRNFPGMRLPGGWDPFEMSVRTILGQHVSVKAANTLAHRLVVNFGTPFEDSYIFPGPEVLAQVDLSAIGMTRKRADTIRTLAQTVVSGDLTFSAALTLDQIVAQLVALPGIGTWTAHCIAMHAFGKADAFPVGDLALQRALADKSNKVLTQSDVLQRANSWRPWRAYATLYLWKEYLNPPNCQPNSASFDSAPPLFIY